MPSDKLTTLLRLSFLIYEILTKKNTPKVLDTVPCTQQNLKNWYFHLSTMSILLCIPTLYKTTKS